MNVLKTPRFVVGLRLYHRQCVRWVFASSACPIFIKLCQSATMMLLVTALRSLQLSSGGGRSSVLQAKSEVSFVWFCFG